MRIGLVLTSALLALCVPGAAAAAAAATEEGVLGRGLTGRRTPKAKAFRVCLNEPTTVFAPMNRMTSIVQDCDTNEVLGWDVWICAPSGGQYYQQSCTERLVVDSIPDVAPSSAFYSYVYDQTTHTYLYPTVLSTTGLFPKPDAFESVVYNDMTNVPPSFNATLILTYKHKSFAPVASARPSLRTIDR